jgi:hypothetical protein
VEACTNSDVVAVASVRWSAWAELATVVAGTTIEVAALALSPRSACVLTTTVVVGTTVEVGALAYFLSFGVDSVSHCVGRHDR